MHLTFQGIYWETAGVWAFSDGVAIDDAIFYSVPTSFFTLDPAIPGRIRELFTEAEGCLKSNFLTGASACARKLVYELAIDQGAEGSSYEERIRSLKGQLTEVDSTFFDTLLTIQELTSEKVHEASYDGWSGAHLRLILASLVEVVQEIYVVPNVRGERRKAILKLKEEVISGKRAQAEASGGTAEREAGPP